MKFSDVDQEYTGTDEVEVPKKVSKLTVEKKAKATTNGTNYVLGEKVAYTITVKNEGNLTVTGIDVTDSLSTNKGQIIGHIDSLAPDKDQEFTFVYTVTEADILKGEVLNTATATGTDSNNESVSGTDTETITTETKNGHLTVIKTTTSNPKNGSAYALGEEITYKVTVTNDGNLTLTDITVTDELTGNVGDAAWKVGSLEPGKSETFEAKYTVTEADILKGEVVNVATAKGTSPDPEKPEVPVDPGEKENPTVTPAPSLFISKEAAEGTPAQVKLGDTINYTITVVNNGNVTLKNVKVKDSLTGDEETYEALKPGDKIELNVTYNVTEKDIL